MRHQSSKLFYGALLTGVFIFALAVSQAFAVFSEPPAGTVPPGNNTPEPVNVGDSFQAKNGPFSVNDFFAVNGSWFFSPHFNLLANENFPPPFPFTSKVFIGKWDPNDPHIVDTLNRADVKMDLNNYIITGVKTPINADDAANKAYVDAATVRPQYSRDCIDFAAKGWDSQDECIHDGRWHKVYGNSASGGRTFGTLANFSSHVMASAEVKVVVPAQGFTGQCGNMATTPSMVICSTELHWGSWRALDNPPGEIHISGIGYYTTGRLQYIHSSNINPSPATTDIKWGQQTLTTAAMDWYVKY